MDLLRGAERLMGMTEEVWRRHANPLSVWTRFTCLPLIVLALWSRVWIGWGALPLLALACFWTWANPRAFPQPLDYGSWASRATLGERIFLARHRYAIAPHHRRAATVLTGLSALGLIPLLWGVVALEGWATCAGLIGVILPKVWFCDRMVWIHADLTGTTPGARLPDPRLPAPQSQSKGPAT